MLKANEWPDGSEELGSASSSDAQPSLRVLSAIEVIGKQGPLTYKELELALNMSRAATWRIVATLKEAGWVRIRFGGRLIELDPRIDVLLASAHFGDAEFIWFDEDFRLYARSLSVHIDVFTLGRDGTPELYETSRRLTATAVHPEGQDELLLRALRAAMTQSQLERHLANRVSPFQLTDQKLASHLRIRREIEQFEGYAWTPCGRYLIASMRGKMGSPAALKISSQVSGASSKAILDAFDSVVQRIQKDVESVAKGIQTIALP